MHDEETRVLKLLYAMIIETSSPDEVLKISQAILNIETAREQRQYHEGETDVIKTQPCSVS